MDRSSPESFDGEKRRPGALWRSARALIAVVGLLVAIVVGTGLAIIAGSPLLAACAVLFVVAAVAFVLLAFTT